MNLLKNLTVADAVLLYDVLLKHCEANPEDVETEALLSKFEGWNEGDAELVSALSERGLSLNKKG